MAVKLFKSRIKGITSSGARLGNVPFAKSHHHVNSMWKNRTVEQVDAQSLLGKTQNGLCSRKSHWSRDTAI